MNKILVSTEALAKALSHSSPDDFAEFWFEFWRVANSNKPKSRVIIRKLAKAIANRFNSKIIFKEIAVDYYSYELILYYKRKNEDA